MMRVGEKELPQDKMKLLKEEFATVKQRTNIDVAEYVDFGKKGSSQIKYYFDEKYHLIGEMS